MSDLLTHYAAARVPASFVRDRRIAALLIAGTFLPDLVAKGLFWVLGADNDFTVPAHSIPGLVLLSYAASLLVEERLRPGAFPAILAGAIVHVAVDLVKDNLGKGSAVLFYPFSSAPYELGWIDTIDVIFLVPAAILVLGAIWAVERKLRRVRE